ncbi:UDP-N-acetylmuramoyl-L-alanyl-D-glutamate--2,6-diaminopimelate ligase [Nocardioides panacisoli]|uniref:UDP-N-acetylmuramoyl-L-alanyl-D-glutamate--2, 6-diaminopimelate ligase n=1 Tax=Nocardioides panacisoli TaxID=627624 RepID=UPI001C62DAED|nr:UDP-N-acetylmuramoyl-L-alanyl-D-glutamate--2,6-diaminopimelate ligase [Nocardioides panacisoli]QYJ04738.1 UDP-N-acetylmuramoyl-L-alanyl-D-glutamate--2,6-diaminopimelate ligase [Nocardioides panacisoli]
MAGEETAPRGGAASATRPRDTPPVRLTDLAARVGSTASGEADVTGITLDSRRVQPGDLYAALPGSTVHGAQFVPQARDAGAVAVVTDEVGAAHVPPELPVVVVASPRAVLGALAAGVYDEPARSMAMVGVTGTQGKTTITRLLESGMELAGVASAVVGTVGTRVCGEDLATALTTPEAPDLHGLFGLMREREVRCCAIEVSSHALVLGRVDGVRFDVAVFTNLGRDHLDFHADVEDYYRAKAELFTPERARLGLVDIDDAHGRRLVEEARIPIRTLSARGSDADWTATDLHLGPDGSRFTLHGPGVGPLPVTVALPGDFNVANALAAIAAATEAGFDAAEVAAGIAATGGVPGRLERVDTDTDYTVVVDYAHKPDAVAAVLHTLRPVTDGRLILVIGAGGDRDRGKRPLMGEIAAASADVLIVTDDNPRSEDPAAIRAEILAGAAGGRAEVREVGGRREAIGSALDLAGPGDVVLVAGKGHETGQEVAGVVHPFDDRAVVRELVAGR